MRTALVTGANGFVGSHLCEELLANGYEVRAFHRENSDLSQLSGLKVQHVTGDLRDPAALESAMQGVDTVFHIGALYRQAKFPDQVYWDVNFEGTKNALSAAKRAGVKRFLHCSTTGVHNHIPNPPADETEPYGPADVYQKSKTEAEKLALDWFRRGEIEGCVIRPTMIWGPRDTRFLKMFRGIARRAFPIIGTGRTLCHWILVTDLARGFRLAAESPNSNEQIYLIGGERPVTLEQTMQAIAETLGVKLLPIKIPAWPIQFAGSVVERICSPLGVEPPIHRRRADFFVKNRAFNCSKAEHELGFKPSYSVERETQLVTKWYVEHGWIQTQS
ncbi:MAG: NAD-dependent epimerase/dehydratase family protein [Bdellovibrionota bacterium]